MAQHDWRATVKPEDATAAEALVDRVRATRYVPGATRVIVDIDGRVCVSAPTEEAARRAADSFTVAAHAGSMTVSISRQEPQNLPEGEIVFELAPWSRRVLATFVDVVPALVLVIALLAIAGQHPIWWSFARHHHLSEGQRAVRFALFLVAGALYFPLVMWRTDGRTLGKFALGIRVIRTDGQSMSIRRAAWRELVTKALLFDLVQALPVVGGTVSFIGSALDDLWPLWDSQNRAVHDMLAATRVVRTTSARSSTHGERILLAAG